MSKEQQMCPNEYYIKNTKRKTVAPVEYLSESLNVTALHTFFFYRYAPEFVFEGESHNFYEFFHTNSGEIIIKTAKGDFLLKTNEFIIIPKDLFHKMSTNKCYASAHIVTFSCDNLQDDICTLKKGKLSKSMSYSLEMIAKTYIDNHVNTGYAMNFMPYSPMKNQYAHEQLLKNSIENLLILANEYFIEQENLKDAGNISSITEKRIETIKKYLEENYNKKITLQDIAKRINYSIPQICRIFKKTTGESPIIYLNKIKIQVALKMISETNKSMEDIATELGFGSETYFCTTFKKLTGLSPKQYAINCRKTHMLNTFYIDTNIIK